MHNKCFEHVFVHVGRSDACHSAIASSLFEKERFKNECGYESTLDCIFRWVKWNLLQDTKVFRVLNATVMGVHCPIELEMDFIAPLNPCHVHDVSTWTLAGDFNTKRISWKVRGFSACQMRQLCVFTVPLSWNWASSLHRICHVHDVFTLTLIGDFIPKGISWKVLGFSVCQMRMDVHCSTEVEMGFIAPQNQPWPQCIHFNSNKKCQLKSKSLFSVKKQQLFIMTEFVRKT